MIDALRGSSVRNHLVAPRGGRLTVPVRGHPAAHTDQTHHAPATWPSTPDRHGAPVSGSASSRAEGGESLSHLAYFYDDERDYLSYLSAFTRAGLRNAEPVFVAVPGRKAALLRERLGAESHLLRYGAITQTGRNPARLIPELRAFLDEHRGRPVRFVSEAIWPGRSAAELCEATRHEALMNLAFASSPATIVCPYDTGALAPSVLAGAERTHPAFLRNGQTQPAADYAGQDVVPAECEEPLPAPPADAQVRAYETSLRPVRELVASHGAALRMTEERITNMVIAAGEITANTLRHTSAGGTFWVWHSGEEIICQVRDRGWIADPLAGRWRRPPEGSGHGLWVVNQVCDLVEIRTSRAAGTVIRLHMRREDT
jgi:anti-sigma regulatory factor (Ser/Thr protein kinase)